MVSGVESTAEEPSSDRQTPSRLLSISMLGPMRVSKGTVSLALPASRKVRGLLAYLVMAPRPLHRSRLCEIFWDGPNDPRSELRWCLSKLRGVLDEPGCTRIRADKDLISIDRSALEVDALRVAEAADGALAGDDVARLERLAAGFDGLFLEGFVSDRTPLFEAWLTAQRERYATLHASILSRTARLLPQLSEKRFAVLRRLIDLAPDDIFHHRDLLTALAAAGRVGEGEAHLGLAKRLLKSHGVPSGPLDAMWQAARQNPPPPLPGPPQTMAPVEPAYRLPPQFTSYIRRTAEEAAVRERFRTSRLVTLVGPGGSGKTRLALEIGRELVEHLPDGLWMVELAALSDPQLVGEALCSCIGAAMVDSRSAAEGATIYLQDKRALVIIDNCEHLLDAVTTVTLALLRSCPKLLVLATSRERLGVQGESLYQVPGLSLPPVSAPLTVETALRHDAIALFEDRAKAVAHGFSLTQANVEAVADICRRLDGFPMAIELVVPQLRMVQPQGLVARLQDRLFVSKGERGALPRHRTLQALFDWSYNLLSEPEQALFRRLSVFTGGWSLEIACAVVADDRVPRDEVFELMSRLVDKSLVVVDLKGAVPRYGFLETTRQYALQKLAPGEDAQHRSRLLGAMIDLCVEADASWPTTPTDVWLRDIDPDLDNLRSCLDWAFGPGTDDARGIALCAYSLRIWDDLALLPERERWFAIAFDRIATAPPPAVLGRLWLGRLSNSAHGDRGNHDLACQAAEFFRLAGDGGGRGVALAKAGAALAAPETTAEAVPFLEEALHLLRPSGATKPLAACLRSLAVTRYFDRDFAASRALLAQSELVARTVGDLRGVAEVQIAAAELAFAAGDPEEAIAQTEAMLSGHHCNRRQRVLGLTNLVAYLLALDRVSEARTAAREGLRDARALDWKGAVVRLVEHLALVSALSGDLQMATSMLGFGIAAYAGGAGSREYTELATYDRLVALLVAVLSPERREQLLATGAAWSAEGAIMRAIAVAEAETAIGSAAPGL